MNLQEKYDLVLAFAQVLHVTGESTDQSITETAHLSERLRLCATIFTRWGEIQRFAWDGTIELVCVVQAAPSGVDMDRAISARRTIDDLRAGKLTPSAAF